MTWRAPVRPRRPVANAAPDTTPMIGIMPPVRAMVNPSDLRQLRDMRRSGTTEAFRGGADPKAISRKFGNTIDRSAFLFKTYNPANVDQVRQADAARIRDRRKNVS